MRMRPYFAIAVALASTSALADPNDFRIFDLGQPAPASCVVVEGGCNIPNSDASKPPTFVPHGTPQANANFRIFIRELAAALTSVNLMPPSSLGHAGFAVNAE